MHPDHHRYLIVSPFFPPPFVGGSKVWTFNMVENAPEGFDILTSPLKTGWPEVVGKKNSIFRVKGIWDSDGGDPSRYDLLRSYLTILWWVWRRHRRVKYSAIVAGSFDFANGLLFLMGKLLGVPVIGLGNTEEFTLALHGRSLKYRVKRWWMKLTHPKADGFIVVCDFCKDILASIGVNPETIFVVPSCINPKKLSPHQDTRQWGHTILSCGRLVERKGFHHLIEAVRLLARDIPDIHLHVVGDGPMYKHLQKLVSDHHLHNNVTIHGKVTDEELSRLYSQSDLFVLAHMMLPNGDTEGCPTVFSEAAGNGLPVIGGSDAGASTAIIEGETGFIVNSRKIDELADRIFRILSNAELARSMGQAGRRKVLRDHVPEVAGLRFMSAVNSVMDQYQRERKKL